MVKKKKLTEEEKFLQDNYEDYLIEQLDLDLNDHMEAAKMKFKSKKAFYDEFHKMSKSMKDFIFMLVFGGISMAEESVELEHKLKDERKNFNKTIKTLVTEFKIDIMKKNNVIDSKTKIVVNKEVLKNIDKLS